MPQAPEVLLFESESEFAHCLQDVLEETGAHVRLVTSYEDLLVHLETENYSFVVCDLLRDKRTEAFLRLLGQLNPPPAKTVFTSIYNDPSGWPSLKDFRGAYLFMPKPFRAQTLLSFLMPAASNRVQRA